MVVLVDLGYEEVPVGMVGKATIEKPFYGIKSLFLEIAAAARRDSNPRPLPPQRIALPTELRADGGQQKLV